MKTNIELSNNYVLKIFGDKNDISINTYDIMDLKVNKIIKEKNFLIIFDFNKLKKELYKKELRKLLYIKK